MSFTSLSFIGFIAATLLLYYLIPKKYRYFALILANIAFYLNGGIKAFAFLLLTSVVSYGCALMLTCLNGLKNADKNRILNYKKIVVFIAAVLQFGILFILKYSEIIYEIVTQYDAGWDLLIPLGISFYTFQSVGYLIDVYRKKVPAEKNFLKFFLFISFFPQMIQGPISRFDHLAPQLFEGHGFSADNFKFGIQRIMLGYMKKLLIADRAAMIANQVFDHYDTYSGMAILVGVLFYSVQLYCDFSGGIDITCGVARLFSIEMTENFRRPIFAVSLTDYWRRWHISLGTWMKDYLFYPLSLSKPFIKLGKFTRHHIKGRAGKILPTSAATFVVYLAIGIWHGANLKYIVFGFYNGIIITAALLLAEVFSKNKKRLHIPQKSKIYNVFCIVRTNCIVILGRYITRASGAYIAGYMIYRTFFEFSQGDSWQTLFISSGLQTMDFAVMFFTMLLIFFMELYEEYRGGFFLLLEKKNFFVQWIAILLPLAMILIFGILNGDYISSEFIYRQF